MYGDLQRVLSVGGVGENDGLGGGRRFDRIIASDCMFFENFHEDLVWTLLHALTKDGVVYMLQPRRGLSMERFLVKAGEFFDITLTDRYDDTVPNTTTAVFIVVVMVVIIIVIITIFTMLVMMLIS